MPPATGTPTRTTVEALLRAEIVVYGITPVRSVLTGGSVAKYAAATGGEMLFPFKADRLARTYPIITRSARNQYVLGYIPNTLPIRSPSAGSGYTWRAIASRTLTVKSRKGYYAVPSF